MTMLAGGPTNGSYVETVMRGGALIPGNERGPSHRLAMPEGALPVVMLDDAAAFDGLMPEERLAGLLPGLRRHPELDLKTLAYHLQQSDATSADGYCHAAINEARSFLEALGVSIALAQPDGSLLKYRKGKESQGGFRQCRRYLQEVGFLDADEDALLQHVYSLASVKGSHHGVTDALWCRLVRRMVGMTGAYLLRRYETWKSGDRRRLEQRAAAPQSARAAPIVRWRRWLVGLISHGAAIDADRPGRCWEAADGCDRRG